MISNYGRIKNIKLDKLKKITLNDDGYVIVKLCKKELLIHRLVCSIFNNNLDNNPVVNHIDENKQNNYYKNLEWVTIDKNNKHSKNKKINMLDNNKKIIKQFESLTEAHKYFNLKHQGCISSQTKKQRKAYGYYWEFV